MKTNLIFILIAAMLSGCSYDALMSAQGWREYIGDGGMMTRKTVLEVDRKHTDIGNDWAERSRACLNNRQVSSTNEVGGSNLRNPAMSNAITLTNSYKATSVINNVRAELHLQEKISGAVLKIAKEPPDGHFFFVADATPISANKSKVVMYYGVNRDLFMTAVSNWAKGKNMGCPDLTKK